MPHGKVKRESIVWSTEGIMFVRVVLLRRYAAEKAFDVVKNVNHSILAGPDPRKNPGSFQGHDRVSALLVAP